eukprot:GHVT01080802.1.p1 GENE.GHVT01080802.1~~GHVT01080802.1.p1  ORF type:complete len:439 (+),score=45.06 GHVT01080802.1:322-1638(+)
MPAPPREKLNAIAHGYDGALTEARTILPQIKQAESIGDQHTQTATGPTPSGHTHSKSGTLLRKLTELPDFVACSNLTSESTDSTSNSSRRDCPEHSHNLATATPRPVLASSSSYTYLPNLSSSTSSTSCTLSSVLRCSHCRVCLQRNYSNCWSSSVCLPGGNLGCVVGLCRGSPPDCCVGDSSCLNSHLRHRSAMSSPSYHHRAGGPPPSAASTRGTEGSSNRSRTPSGRPPSSHGGGGGGHSRPHRGGDTEKSSEAHHGDRHGGSKQEPSSHGRTDRPPPGRITVDKLTDRLVAYYTKHNPDKVQQCGEIAATWFSKLPILDQRLRECYGKDLRGRTLADLLSKFYKQHNAGKLDMIDSIVEEFQQDESLLNCKLRDIYQIDLNTDNTEALLRRFYRRHCPDKMDRVADISGIFEGDEETLNMLLAARYDGHDLLTM